MKKKFGTKVVYYIYGNLENEIMSEIGK